MVRHARRMSAGGVPLCGSQTGVVTKPKEVVNCPCCRVILNYVRQTYPAHAEYTDWRLTKAELKRAAQDMAADMAGGAND
jgi:hypothetical protein